MPGTLLTELIPLTSCDNETGLPTGCPTAPWWPDLCGVDPGTFEQPRRE